MNTGDTAWVLISAALVMLMTPGLAFFYGGMVRSKSVLNMLMMSFISLAVVSVLWVLYGYSLAFGNDLGAGLLGNFDNIGLKGVLGTLGGPADHQFPTMAFVMFQLMFAIITPALISGAIADRAKFWGWTLFIGLWVTIVYFPVAHWVFAFSSADGSVVGGWIANNLKALDFAGGTAVHINAGAAGLAVALVLGKRKGWPKEPMRPHNLPFVLLGAALLWFGWYGFNAGSALGANETAAVAFATTTVATAAAVLGWLLVEQIRDGKPTTLGAASGAVAGLVAITPACAFVSPLGAIAIGVIAGALCSLAVGLKFRFGYDDSLDVVGVHLVGGLVGTLLIGLFGTTSVNSAGADGLFYGGGVGLLGRQAVAAVAVLAFSFVLTFVIAFVVNKTVGFRAAEESEVGGIDEAEHAESAYEFGAFSSARGANKGSVTAGATAVLEGSNKS
ncbi:ammonium transporter [Lentzea aerocolonigenes]|uniref:ammonium transporter n=1 Tax=Lentzea aerocolonigenes TaxID=68170 RepID=UPI000568AD28|nr:ammonium transporter [Lentzea aerocolonigenes]MCP2249319.1 ammonium transporter, Amt family [Lentzea aerocolonigenes]